MNTLQVQIQVGEKHKLDPFYYNEFISTTTIESIELDEKIIRICREVTVGTVDNIFAQKSEKTIKIISKVTEIQTLCLPYRKQERCHIRGHSVNGSFSLHTSKATRFPLYKF
jgi:hypothetical protein